MKRRSFIKSIIALLTISAGLKATEKIGVVGVEKTVTGGGAIGVVGSDITWEPTTEFNPTDMIITNTIDPEFKSKWFKMIDGEWRQVG